MRQRFRTVDEAKRRFDEYVKSEPRLRELWLSCRIANANGRHANDTDIDDVFDIDLYDVDHLSRDTDDWCAERWFAETVKPRFATLVGWYRSEGELPELHTSSAYDDVYAALFYFALNVTCRCCRQDHSRGRRHA